MVSGFTVTLFYVFTWWLVLLAVLPFGVKRPDVHEEGHSTGAPHETHLKRKLIATTLIAAVFTFIFFWMTDGMLILPENT